MIDQGIAKGAGARPRSSVVPRIRGLDVLLVTSGLGPRYGGIGCVVAEHARHSSEPMAASRG